MLSFYFHYQVGNKFTGDKARFFYTSSVCGAFAKLQVCRGLELQLSWQQNDLWWWLMLGWGLFFKWSGDLGGTL